MIEAIFFVVASVLAFVVPTAIPLFVRRWPAFAIVLLLGTIFFAWFNGSLMSDPPGQADWFGSFLGGLALIGFGFGAIAKFAMLLGRPKEPPENN